MQDIVRIPAGEARADVTEERFHHWCTGCYDAKVDFDYAGEGVRDANPWVLMSGDGG